MAVAVKFITLVVRKDAIEQKVDGGWVSWLSMHKNKLGKICWHDEFLFAISWMNNNDIAAQIKEYEEKGLSLKSQHPETKQMDGDMCIVEMMQFSTHCDWLEIIEDDLSFGISGVKLSGEEADTIVGPNWQSEKITTTTKQPFNGLFERLLAFIRRGIF